MSGNVPWRSGQLSVRAAMLVLYLGAVAAWLYLGVDPHENWITVPLGLLLIPVHLAIGYVLGRRGFLLAALAIPLAVPAGKPEGSEADLWRVVIVMFAVAVLLIWAGAAGKERLQKRKGQRNHRKPAG